MFFLGTKSTSPSVINGASAIYIFKNGYGILMDCAEGSYAQIMDHFDNVEIVNKVLLRTQFIFITHLHGDHQHGILKIL